MKKSVISHSSTVQYANSVYVAILSIMYKSQLEKIAHTIQLYLYMCREEKVREEKATSCMSSHVLIVMCLHTQNTAASKKDC